MALKVDWTLPEQRVQINGREVVVPAETVTDAFVAVERAEYYRRTKTVVALVQPYREKDGEPIGPILEFGFDPEGPQIEFDPTKDNAAAVYDWLKADQEFAAAFENAKEDAGDLLEEEARRRAHDGWLEPVFRKGERAWDAVDEDGNVVHPGDERAVSFVPAVMRKYSDGLKCWKLIWPVRFLVNNWRW